MVRLFVFLVMLLEIGDALHCLEGSDCVDDASCGECSGVACTRIVSNDLDDNREVALTCLPYDTRNFQTPQLEEQGCRKIENRQLCICYNHDYCNSTNSLISGSFSTISQLLILIYLLRFC